MTVGRRGRWWRRLATAGVVAAVALVGCAPTIDDHEVVRIAEGPDWYVEVVPGPTLQWEVRGDRDAQVTVDTGGMAMDYRGQRRLTDAATIQVPAGAGEHTVVAGPVADEAEQVTLTTGNGDEHDTDLVVAKGWQWYVGRVPQSSGMLHLEALDADGEVIDDAQVRIFSPAP